MILRRNRGHQNIAAFIASSKSAGIVMALSEFLRKERAKAQAHGTNSHQMAVSRDFSHMTLRRFFIRPGVGTRPSATPPPNDKRRTNRGKIKRIIRVSLGSPEAGRRYRTVRRGNVKIRASNLRTFFSLCLSELLPALEVTLPRHFQNDGIYPRPSPLSAAGSLPITSDILSMEMATQLS